MAVGAHAYRRTIERRATASMKVCSRRSSGLLLIVGNLHTCQCGTREFDSCQIKVFILAMVAESVRT